MLQNSTRLADLPGMGFAAKIGLGAGQPQTNVEDAARDQFTGPLKPIARSRTILRLETNPRVSRTVVRPISAPDPPGGGPRPISGFFSLQTNPRVSRTVVRPIGAPDPHAGGTKPMGSQDQLVAVCIELLDNLSTATTSPVSLDRADRRTHSFR